ncbi:MAG: hypothetical protein ACJAV4_000038 [Pontimonas sp.]
MSNLSFFSRLREGLRAGAVNTPTPVFFLVGGVALTMVVGLVVQTVAPRPPLIVIADSGMFAEGAESLGESGLFVESDYLAGEGLSSQPGQGTVYEMVLEGTPEGALRTLGSFFGVTGDALQSEYFSPQWQGYVVGSEDWSAPSVTVTWNGSGGWYYSNPSAYVDPICEEIPAPEGSGELPGWECYPPEPGLALPSPAEAKALAQEAFRVGGLEVATEDIYVLSDDEWGIGVSATMVVGGEPTALEWTMFWVPGPTLASATGHSARAVSRGLFDTVSPEHAVQRLASGSWWGAPALDYEHSDHQGHAQESSWGEGQPLEARERTIIGSTATSVLVWDALGGQWIVPGYLLRYGQEEWERAAVISLQEGVIKLQEVMGIDESPPREDGSE